MKSIMMMMMMMTMAARWKKKWAMEWVVQCVGVDRLPRLRRTRGRKPSQLRYVKIIAFLLFRMNLCFPRITLRQLYIHTYIHTYMHTYIHTSYLRTYIHTYIRNTCIHTYAKYYTYIHTYALYLTCIHTYIKNNVLMLTLLRLPET